MPRRKITAASLLAALFLALPAAALAETWTLDPAHTVVGFQVRYSMVSWVRGSFPEVKGEAVYVLGKPETARVEIVIGAASIDSRHERRDNHLRSADFLDVERHKTIAFKSKRVQNPRPDGFDLVGDLTIRGVTKEVVLKVADLSGPAKDARGRARLGASASAKISRKDFGLVWNRLIEAGGVLVGDDVHINIDVQLLKKG